MFGEGSKHSCWHAENPSESGIGGNCMYDICMWVLKYMASVFTQSVYRVDRVRKCPHILVLEENITMTHVACFTLNDILCLVTY